MSMIRKETKEEKIKTSNNEGKRDKGEIKMKKQKKGE